MEWLDERLGRISAFTLMVIILALVAYVFVRAVETSHQEAFLAGQITRAETQYNAIDAKLTDTQNKLAAAQAELAEDSYDRASLANTITALQGQLHGFGEDIAALEAQLHHLGVTPVVTPVTLDLASPPVLHLSGPATILSPSTPSSTVPTTISAPTTTLPRCKQPSAKHPC